ncbi:MAG: LysR substrate-binding domain-containing protein [Pseudomonadota bacterium]
MVVNRRTSAVPSTKMLTAFEATGRLGSAVKAGQELNVSHTTISRHIHSLEEQLNLKLFERHGSGLKLSNSGQRIFKAVSKTFEDLVRTLDEEALNSSLNRILISTTSSIAQGWLLQRLAEYRFTDPTVEIELTATQAFDDIDKDEIDVVLRMGDGSWPMHHLEPLCDDLIYPVCSPSFMQDNDGKVDLAAQPSSSLVNDLDPLLDWSEWVGDCKDDENVGCMRLQGGELSSEAAKRGLGIALVRHLTVSDDIERGNLVPVGKDFKLVRNAVWVGGARNSLHKVHVRRFRSWLHREANRNLTEFLHETPIREA